MDKKTTNSCPTCGGSGWINTCTHVDGNGKSYPCPACQKPEQGEAEKLTIKQLIEEARNREILTQNILDVKVRAASWLAVAKLCEQLGFCYSGKASGLEEILTFIDAQAAEIAALKAENDKIRELVIHQIPCIRGLGVENDTSQTPTLDLVKVVVNENEKLKGDKK